MSNTNTYELHVTKQGEKLWLPTGQPQCGRHEITHGRFQLYLEKERALRYYVDDTKAALPDGTQAKARVSLVQSILKFIIPRRLARKEEK